ncbi:glycosyltransferase family 2 protein, partial [Thermococcus sp.]
MRSMRTRNYILVTPAKNEEKTLPLLAKSIVNQTLKPKLWVIVNDNSTDGTGDVVHELESQYNWIVGVDLIKNNGYPSDYDPIFGNILTYKIAISYALSYSKEKGIPFGYLGIVDADFILERKFFAKLISKFLENPRLGIISGGVYIIDNGTLRWERSNIQFPRGSPRLIRFECLFDIGGYPSEPAPDLVAYYLAKVKGWETLQLT